MPKMKTHKGTAKRFRLTGTGKVVRRRAFRSHILEKKSPKRKAKFTKMDTVHSTNERTIKRMLGLG